MIFLILTPVPPPHLGTPFWGGVGGGGVGVKTSLHIVAAVCVLGPGSRRTFFLYIDPLTHDGSRVPTPGTPSRPPPPPIWPLASEYFAVFKLGRLFSDTRQRLLDQSQAGPYISETATCPPHFGAFWVYSRTPPQGVDPL